MPGPRMTKSVQRSTGVGGAASPIRDAGRRRDGQLEHAVQLLERVHGEHVQERQSGALGDPFEVGARGAARACRAAAR